MADTTKLTIELEVLLRNLNRTLRGLNQIEQRLRRVASIRINAQQTQGTQRAILAAQRLQLQQQRLVIATQQTATAQGRATVAAQRLALAQQRLAQAQQRTTQASLGLNIQQNRHVQVFRAMQHAAGQFNRTLTSLGNSLRSVGQGFASFGATLAFSVSAPLAAMTVNIVDAAVRMDSLRRGLTTIAGSSELAAIQLERLTELARLPGIGFEEAIQGSIRLQAVGFSAEEAEKALRQFSNAIALTGGGREQLESVTVQLGQMAAQSKVLAADLKPIINAAPAVAVALREAFGTVRSEELQELGISSKQFIDTLVTQLEKLPRAAAGARNSFENFRDEIFRAAAVIGTTLLPSLTRLAEVVGPVVLGLANAFAKLPAPLQTIVVGLTALLAVSGPILFIMGQLGLAVGRLLVGFVQLNAAGIGPTIASLRALTAGTLSASAAQRTLAGTTALVAGAVGGVVALLAGIVTVFAAYKAFQQDSIKLSREQVDALTDQIDGLKEQLKFVEGLQSGVQRTADEQQRLLDIYLDLNRTAKVRVTGVKDEEQQLAALREELVRLIALREQERLQAAATAAAALADSLLKIRANEQERDAIAERIQANSELIQTLEREQKISDASNRALAERGITAATVEDAIGRLKAESESLSQSQDDLIVSGKELNDLAKDQVALVRAIEQATGLTARQLLEVARNMGRFRGEMSEIIPILERYIQKMEEATRSTDEFSRVLDQQERELRESGKRADEEQKRRRGQIAAAAALAREASTSFQGALKFMLAFIEAQPRLRADIERERQIAGKTFEEFISDALESAFGRGKRDAGGALRRQLESLQDAQNKLAATRDEGELAQSRSRIEAQFDIARAGLEREERSLENSFDDRLTSIKTYLKEREALENAQIDRDIQRELELTAVLFRELFARRRAVESELKAERTSIDEDPRLQGEARAAAIRAAELNAAVKLEQALADFNTRKEEHEARVAVLEGDRKKNAEERLRFTRLLNEELAKQQVQIRADLFDEQGRTADAEVLRLKARFTETLHDLRIDTAGLGAELQDALNSVDLTILQQRLDELPEPVRVLIELLDIGIKRAQIAEAQTLVENLSAGLRLGEEQIQNRVLDGIISQRDAQVEIVALQQKYRALLLDILQGELAKAEAIKDQGQITAIQGQIAEVERLGIAIDEVGIRINQALFSDLQSGISSIFSGARKGFEGLRDAAISFGERLLDTLNDIAATSIMRELEDLFKPDAQNTKGTVGGFLSKLFGLQPKQQADAAAASATLQAGAATASAALTTGAATAGTSFGATVVTSAASFAATIIGAAAAFAATVAGAQAASQIASSGAEFARFIGGGASGLFAAVPGGVYRALEGGHPEAILTTDPKHYARQLEILRTYLRETRGLGGRIRGFAAGGFAIPDLSLNVPAISLPSGNFSDAEISSPQNVSLRILNLLDKRQLVGGHLRSAEGARDIMNVISENSEEIGRRIGIK